jgi:hypothetical protein
MIFDSTVAHLADSFMGLPDAHAIGKSLAPKSKGGGEIHGGRGEGRWGAGGEQRWQPLGDGCWGRVVGREGTDRSVGRSHVWKESGLLNWGRAK